MKNKIQIIVLLLLSLTTNSLFGQIKSTNERVVEAPQKPKWWKFRNIIFNPYDSSYVKVKRYPTLEAYKKYIGQELFLPSFDLPEAYHDNRENILINSLLCGGDKSDVGKYFTITAINNLENYRCDIHKYVFNHKYCTVNNIEYSIPRKDCPEFTLKEKETGEIFYTVFPDYYIIVGGFEKLKQNFIGKIICELSEFPNRVNYSRNILENIYECTDIVLHPKTKNKEQEINLILRQKENRSFGKEVNYEIINERGKSYKNKFYLTKDTLNFLTQKKWGKPILEKDNQIRKEVVGTEVKDNTLNVILLIFIGILILGLILGYSKVIVVYRDYADLTKSFSLFGLPILLYFVYSLMEINSLKSLYILEGIVVTFLFVWIVISTYRDNKNIFWTIIAIFTKLIFSLVFFFYLLEVISPSKNKTRYERNEDRIKALAILFFILKLVRHRVWTINKTFEKINLKEILLAFMLTGVLAISGYIYLEDSTKEIIPMKKTSKQPISNANSKQKKFQSTHTNNKQKIETKQIAKSKTSQKLHGRFTIASIQYLTDSYLQNISKHDLKIMRNEIFARHGYIFKKNGLMDNYFSQQEWYKPKYKNINEKLTQIEKTNIELIKKYEN